MLVFLEKPAIASPPGKPDALRVRTIDLHLHMDTPPFSELGLPDTLLAAIETLGYERPSPIQFKSIPPALEGKDILGLSATGHATGRRRLRALRSHVAHGADAGCGECFGCRGGGAGGAGDDARRGIAGVGLRHFELLLR